MDNCFTKTIPKDTSSFHYLHAVDHQPWQ